MQERTNNSDYRKTRNCDLTRSKSAHPQSILEDKGHEVRHSRGCDCMDEIEIQYDWIITLARMWDNPNQDFDLNLNKEL